MNFTLHHLKLADSLMKKFIWLQKQTLSNYKKELNNINQIKKEAYTPFKNNIQQRFNRKLHY